MTSYSSGDAKWVFADVPVSPNTTYTFGDAYRSNVSTQLVIRYTLTGGSQTYVWVADLAAASNWANAYYQITTPAGVVSMTVFHLIHSVGWLETDRFSLAPPSTGGGGGSTGGMISLTFDDGWGSQLQNAVPVLRQANLPATFYIITRANQGGAAWEEVQNRSLETAGDGGPVGWNTYRTGTNTTAFTYATTGSDGTRSARVDVSSYSGGDAGWYFQDVAVQGGTQYAVSHQYNATVPTSVLVRFTNHDGSVTWVDEGGLAGHQRSVGHPAVHGDGPGQRRCHDRPAPDQPGRGAIDGQLLGQAGQPVLEPELHDAGPDPVAPGGRVRGRAHTMTHADLTTLSAAGARAEVVGSKADLAALGIAATTLAYPYGSYNTAVEQTVTGAGFVAARTVNDGYNTGTTDRFALMHREVDLTRRWPTFRGGSTRPPRRRPG